MKAAPVAGHRDYPTIGCEDMISVVVPAYNAEKWLMACCESVFAQTISDWELIIVDDGSTDGTLEIAQQAARNRKNVRAIHTENGGVCYARNVGLDEARGDYITFLDADDALMPDALERLLRLIQDKNCDIAIGWKTNMTADGQIIGCPYDRVSGLWHGTAALEQSLRDHPATYSVWGKLYKRSVVENVRFVEGRKVHEDSFFLFQCLLKEPTVAVTEEIVMRYRLSQNSASRSAFSDKVFDILYFAEEKKRLVEAHYPQFQDLARNVLVKAHMALLHNLCNTTDSKYRSAEKASIQFIQRNKTYFISAQKADERWYQIIVRHMYPLYKAIYRIKNRGKFQ